MIITSIYTKPGATFSNGDEAYANKNSLYGPELTVAVDAGNAKLLADGVLLEPIAYTWDQATSTLTMYKTVVSQEAYDSAVASAFDVNLAVTRSAEAGWTIVIKP